ncbi:probable tubulin polyglutamylase TTLL2 isoform X3 [Trichoplusia ni]|uniref:Probable tubulin polyglutamylase TTLL2 isoform X3 n=1 Tax=Trichoplusia ni TaxID=7111 RepID=A0A7E5VM72_TRINI|nr:probable tubulin polyglutamylase TTLL2 isoform X3 [Trichoplusia ni]
MTMISHKIMFRDISSMDGSFDDDEPFIFRLNENGSGPGLLVKVCAERGWRVYQGYHTGLEERWNLWWKTSAFPAASYKTLGDWQFMNHIPKGGSICRKDNLSRLLRCMKRIYGAVYDFSPPCYHLPLEYAKLVSECSRLRRDENGAGANVVWIHKPVAQSQGRGIFLFRSNTLFQSLCEMNCGTSAVVQRYIERPLLIAGYKFDLRLYVCVPGYRPLTAYMYAEGLARFGTDKYTLSDIHNPYRHLTNSSLNKSGPRYAEWCKWTLTQVRRALIGRWGAAEWVVWQRIRALVTLTLLAQAAGTPPARNCFEFYGFDVLLDDCLKPWLLEVNLSPALASDCEADVVVKQPMLHELFDLLGLPMKHTGLAKLQAPPPPTPNLNSCSSEDENGSTKSGRTRTAPRRGARVRRRRAMPMHCVTLQGPGAPEKAVPSSQSTAGAVNGSAANAPPDKTNDSIEKGKELNSGRYKCADTNSEAEVQSTSNGSIPATETVDESWRGGYSTAASRRRVMTACHWGNGVKWNQAIGRVGHWVRIYPHSLPKDDELPVEDVRDSVAQVSKFVRAAREVSRECGKDTSAPRDAARDAVFEEALRKKLDFGPHFQVWLPPF